MLRIPQARKEAILNKMLSPHPPTIVALSKQEGISENPNAGMGGAAAGTVLGYGFGKAVEVLVDKHLNPWYKPDWKDAGIGFGVVKPNNPSTIPGILGNVTSGAVQELVGNSTKDTIQKGVKK